MQRLCVVIGFPDGKGEIWHESSEKGKCADLRVG